MLALALLLRVGFVVRLILRWRDCHCGFQLFLAALVVVGIIFSNGNKVI